VQRVRALCPDCGPRGRTTGPLLRLGPFHSAAILPAGQPAEFHELHLETVKHLHQEHLQRTLEPTDLSEIEVIAVD
jgi:hypothetical protein